MDVRVRRRVSSYEEIVHAQWSVCLYVCMSESLHLYMSVCIYVYLDVCKYAFICA